MATRKVDYVFNSYPFCFEGNQSGCPVRKENASLGDGDIHTSDGSRTEVSVGASLNVITVGRTKMARVHITYYVWEPLYGKKPSQDKLYFLANKDCPLLQNTAKKYRRGDYIYSESVRYELIGDGESCYYRDYFNNYRHDWCHLSETVYPRSNRTRDWLRGNSIYVKVDGPGNDLMKYGNLGVKGTIVLKYKRTTIVDSIYSPITREPVQTASDLQGVLNAYPMKNFKDGCAYYEPLKDTPGRRGTYLRLEQQPREIQDFLIENGDEGTFYPGNILATDSHFLTQNPTVINLQDNERRPVSYMASTSFYMGSNSDDPLENVIPTLRNFSRAKAQFVYNYARACDNRNGMGMNISIDEYTSESSEGLTLGGTIKKVSFDLHAGERNQKVHAFILRQKMYTVKLDNTYNRGSDLINASTVNLARLKSQLNGTAPAVISSVDYGRVAIIYVTSTDNTAFKAEIAGCKLNVGDSSNCSIKVKILGGPIAGYSRGDKLDGLAYANKIISELYEKPVTSSDISTALPISFQAKFLRNMGYSVKCNVLPYKQVYVETIRMRIQDDNSGVIFAGLKFRWLDFMPDRYGHMGYVKYYNEKAPTCDHFISPKSVCLEFKVDARGGEYCDNNIFCPEIPLEQLRPDSDGYWTFTLYLTGSTLGSIGYRFSPTLPGCYRSTENDTYMSKNGILAENAHRHYSKRDCLVKFYSWCEWHRRRKSYMHRLTASNYSALAPFTDRDVYLFYRGEDLRY